MRKNSMKAIVFLADGFEECEGLIVVDILRRAGVDTVMASAMSGLQIDSSRHIKVMADAMASDVDYDAADLIVLPGGRLGTENLGANPLVVEKCREFAAGKYLAAICAAPSLLAALGLLEGRKATCHPDFEGHMKGAVLTG
jgi:4-methyl-5(b-hydroxyethyl)-thiazole monophosphate biosynthesis